MYKVAFFRLLFRRTVFTWMNVAKIRDWTVRMDCSEHTLNGSWAFFGRLERCSKWGTLMIHQICVCFSQAWRCLFRSTVILWVWTWTHKSHDSSSSLHLTVSFPEIWQKPVCESLKGIHFPHELPQERLFYPTILVGTAVVFTPVSRSRWASLGATPLRCRSLRWEAAISWWGSLKMGYITSNNDWKKEIAQWFICMEIKGYPSFRQTDIYIYNYIHVTN